MDFATLGNIGSLLGGLSDIYSTYKASKLAKEQINLMKQNYLRNKRLQALGQANLKAGVDAVFAPKPLGSYYNGGY